MCSVLDVVCAGCGHVSKENRKTQAQFRNPDLDPVLSADQEKGTSRLGCVGVASGATLILRCRSYNFQFFPQM
jgi:hypothetical protein